jgi:hypothetical protein
MFGRSKTNNSRRIIALSLAFSLITIAGVIWINYQIAQRYETSTGKTRALFGIIELTYSYKYFLSVVGIFASAFGIIVARRGQRQLGLSQTL